MKGNKLLLAGIPLILICVSLVVFPRCVPDSQEPGASDTQEDANSDATEPETVNFSWSMDTDCTACHIRQAESLSDTTLQASIHANRGAGCVTCHADFETLATVHEQATADGAGAVKKLKKTKIDEASCLQCHGTQKSLAEKTQTVTILTDKEGTMVNPHALPDTQDHSALLCSTCHSMHADEPVEGLALAACQGCHHEKVYQCYVCHE